jgi:hypothetical protein
VLVSGAAWEITTKARLGKLPRAEDVAISSDDRVFDEYGVRRIL